MNRCSFSLILAISKEFVHWIVKDTTNEGVKCRDFVVFLNELINFNSFDEKPCFVMDNARIHHTDAVEHFMEDNELSYTYLPGHYQLPDFNPIEPVFGWIKGRISGKTEDNMYQVIEEAIASISNETIDNFYFIYLRQLESQKVLIKFVW